MTYQTQIAKTIPGIWKALRKKGFEPEQDGRHVYVVKDGERVGEIETYRGDVFITSLRKTMIYKGTEIRRIYRTAAGFIRYGI
jgi:hypothetical protein